VWEIVEIKIDTDPPTILAELVNDDDPPATA
jgi:hypothetical protein